MRLLMAILISQTAVDAVHAGVTFLGPTPYLSKADSLFPVDGSNPNFYLEDFEDGELNTPGISQRNLFPLFGDGALAVVTEPSNETDSIDEDDGLIDSLGRGGHSLRSSLDIIVDTFPPIHSFEIAFDFDELELGYYPTAFGVVWTDGPENSSFSIQITTPVGNSFNSEVIRGIGDASRDGETHEDFFLGVIATDGIASVLIRGSYIGDPSSAAAIEIDHVQYGLVAVPEPIGLLLSGFGVICIAFPRCRRLCSCIALALIFAVATNNCIAGATFLGPTPYLSKADSPFPVDGSNPNFYLEDFEDGELNTPGIFQPLAQFTHGIVFEGSSPEISVDGHEGSPEDGSAYGWAMRSNFSAFRPTDPVVSTSYLRFAFDKPQLGWLPNSFGFVWTSGPVEKIIRIGGFDDQSNLLHEIVFDGINEEGFPSEPAHFLGGWFDSGVYLIEISVTYEGSPEFFVVDHVQYGLLVSEPSSFVVITVTLAIYITTCFIRRSVFGYTVKCPNLLE